MSEDECPDAWCVGASMATRLQAAHTRVVEAEVMVRAWRGVIELIGNKHPGLVAAENEAASAQKAWEALLREL